MATWPLQARLARMRAISWVPLGKLSRSASTRTGRRQSCKRKLTDKHVSIVAPLRKTIAYRRLTQALYLTALASFASRSSEAEPLPGTTSEFDGPLSILQSSGTTCCQRLEQSCARLRLGLPLLRTLTRHLTSRITLRCSRLCSLLG